ncbi:MAG: hypothetical protein ACRDNZ_01160 [Streptosporangiaceae bacterium]
MTNKPPGRPGHRADRLIGICAYAALFVLGVGEAVIGCFQYSRGPAPFAAIGFGLGILATCLLAGWGMRTALGGLMPGIGWLATSIALATGTQGGSVLITNTAAGQWFLFGGAVCATAGCLVAYLCWSAPARDARAGRSCSRGGR